MADIGQGHNSATIAAGDWAFEVAQTRTHAFIKLIVHTLRLLVKDGEADADISDEELSRLTSLSTKTVQRYRQMAKEEGWLEFNVGKGRSKVSSYRISVPMDTINQIAARLDALTKNRTDSPPLKTKVDPQSTFSAENRTSSPPLTQKPDQQSTLRDENWTDSPTAGNEAANVPPHPPKINNIYNNNPPLSPQTGRSKADPFGLNRVMNDQYADCWFDEDDRLQVANGFRAEMIELVGSESELRIELDAACTYVGPKTPGTVLKTKVRGQIARQVRERQDRDRRYEKAASRNRGSSSGDTELKLSTSDIPKMMPRPREEPEHWADAERRRAKQADDALKELAREQREKAKADG